MPRMLGSTATVSYDCLTQTVSFTNIVSTPPVAFVWARVDSGTGTAPSALHPYENVAVKAAVIGNSAAIRDPSWPQHGQYTVHYWFDYGYAKVSMAPADCPSSSSSFALAASKKKHADNKHAATTKPKKKAK